MASLYYELESGTDVYLLEDGSGNYLLEPITGTYIRHIRRSLPIAATVGLVSEIYLQLDGEDGYVRQEVAESPNYMLTETTFIPQVVEIQLEGYGVNDWVLLETGTDYVLDERSI